MSNAVADPATGATGGDLVISSAAAAAGGILGGVVFGLMMQSMSLIPMVAGLVGSTSPVEGWAVHMSISVTLAVWFGMLTYRVNRSAPVILLGLGYGIFWWVLGALLIMPAALGMPLLRLSPTAWGSLAGHLLYGLITAIGAILLDPRPTWWERIPPQTARHATPVSLSGPPPISTGLPAGDGTNGADLFIPSIQPLEPEHRMGGHHAR